MSNLPQYLTPFVGRETDLTALTRLLDDPACRLVTLVGPGGIGKTRLAVEAAQAKVDTYPDGVYFIPLQPLQHADQVLPAIIATLSFQTIGELQQDLLDYLHRKQMLLILDNFEHVLAASTLVDEILAAAPHVIILVTSRERLKLQGEWVRRVDGLAYPAADSGESPYSAIELFVESVRRLHHDFSLDSEYEHVARICELVEGMPLGLELAAGWTTTLTCHEIVNEIQHNLNFLSSDTRNLPERHRSIQAVFDHSWRLLTVEEQRVMRRFAVFRGGCSRDAAGQVAGASLRILASLINKSLLRLDNNGRYELHELLRQYGYEQLELAGESHEAHDAHSAYYADFISRRVEDLKGRRQLEAIAEINVDFENVRTAWNWAAAQKIEATVKQMLEGLWLFCNLRSREQDSFAAFQYAEQQFAPEYNQTPGQTWGKLLARVAVRERSQSRLETALEIAQRFNDLAEIAFCLAQLSVIAHARREFDRAKQLIEQSLTIYRQLEDQYAVAGVLWTMMDYGYEGPYKDIKHYGEHYGEESLKLRREIGDHVGMAWSLIVAALLAGREGQFEEAERLWLERVKLGQEIGDLSLTALGYAHVSHKVYFIQGNFDRARVTAEDALTIGTKIDNRNAVGWALATLGLLASMNENYAEGKRLCQQSISEGNLAVIADLATWGLAIASCGLGDYKAAKEYLLASSNFLTKILGAVGAIGSLPVFAIILANLGQRQRAVELLALALTHPLKAAGWIEKWPLLARLRADMETDLGDKVYAEAWERGSILDLETTYQQLLQAMKSELNRPKLLVNHQLVDPLSPRELEVLALIAEGRTNREIADHLYIGINTVKKHVNHIYSKLNVKDRTEAINCANTLGLIS